MNTQTACKMARALEDVSEKEHFGSDAFYAHKRIFATVWHTVNQVNLRLTPELQAEFIEDPEAFSPVANAFGKQGWTTVHLDYVERDAFAKALKAAWTCSATKRPSKAKKKKKVTSSRKPAARAPARSGHRRP